MLAAHASQVLDIYRQGIETGVATFETALPTWTVFDDKHLTHSRLVALEEKLVCGWAALSPVSPRECYAGVAEVSVYVHETKKGMGIGRKLLEALVVSSEQNGIWSLLSVIDDGNIASLQLHLHAGFRQIGYRERIAKLNGRWRTTIMMEKRSKIVGV